MGPTLEPEDEIKEEKGHSPELRDTDRVLPGSEAVQRASAEPPQNAPLEPVPSPAKKARLAKRVAFIAVALLLTGVAYVERVKLAKFFSPAATDGASASKRIATGEREGSLGRPDAPESTSRTNPAKLPTAEWTLCLSTRTASSCRPVCLTAQSRSAPRSSS